MPDLDTSPARLRALAEKLQTGREFLGAVEETIALLRAWAEEQEQREKAANKLREALEAMRLHADGIDNGYCRLCRRHRKPDTHGGSNCENDECLSHRVASALSGAQRKEEG